ncbi:hypothetical protein RUND412_006459 [Rhizina undulata]
MYSYPAHNAAVPAPAAASHPRRRMADPRFSNPRLDNPRVRPRPFRRSRNQTATGAQHPEQSQAGSQGGQDTHQEHRLSRTPAPKLPENISAPQNFDVVKEGGFYFFPEYLPDAHATEVEPESEQVSEEKNKDEKPAQQGRIMGIVKRVKSYLGFNVE